MLIFFVREDNLYWILMFIEILIRVVIISCVECDGGLVLLLLIKRRFKIL